MSELRLLLNNNEPALPSRRVFLAGLVGFLAGSRLEAQQPGDLSPIYLQGVKITRTAKNIQGYEIIVLHKSEKLLPERLYNHDSFQALLDGDPTTADNGYILAEEGNPWTIAGEVGSPSFNCHSYAVGEKLGLTPSDWLEGSSSPLTNNTNPLGIILEKSFRRIGQYPVGQSPLVFMHDDKILSGDLVVLSDGSSYDYVHSGRVRKVKGKNWVASKFGEGPLVVTPLAAIEKEYQDKYDSIQIFRLKKDKQNE